MVLFFPKMIYIYICIHPLVLFNILYKYRQFVVVFVGFTRGFFPSPALGLGSFGDRRQRLLERPAAGQPGGALPGLRGQHGNRRSQGEVPDSLHFMDNMVG